MLLLDNLSLYCNYIYILRALKTIEAFESTDGTPKNRAGKIRDSQEHRRKQQVHSRMQVLLFRHKELLKKDILKKRALLEKELQIDIQVRRQRK